MLSKQGMVRWVEVDSGSFVMDDLWKFCKLDPIVSAEFNVEAALM